MVDVSDWSRCTSSILVVQSVCDKPDKCTEGHSRVLCHKCDTCGAQFASLKVLESHSRRKHGERSPYSLRTMPSVYTCCQVNFHSRASCPAHIGDRRHPRCAEFGHANCAILSTAEPKHADEVTRAEKRTAWKQGLTHVYTERPASVIV